MYFFGSGTTEPAISREIMENDLMETFHWLPQDIAKIPYKKLQKIMLIRKHKNESIHAKAQMEKTKKEFYNSMGNKGTKGGPKRFVREV